MQKFITDNRNGITYELIGDYYYPCLTAPKSPDIGFFGRMRKRYLEECHKAFYYQLLTSGKLADHLEEIDRAAYDMQELLISQMAKAQGVTEALKATNQMKWVGMMNNIRNAAMKIVLTDLVYA